MYCVKCKQKTDTITVKPIISKNKRQMVQGNCIICGCKKSLFIKNHIGHGFNTVLNELPIELHLPASQEVYIPNGSFDNFQKYSYCGPGTRYVQRTKKVTKELINWIVCANYMINFTMKI